MPEDSVKSPGVFSWVVPALRTRRTMKTWIRCCVALATTMVLMVERHTLGNLGQAAFFTSIVAVMLPPSFALSLFTLAATTLLFGMVLGWAWACAMMAAGLSVRNPALLAQQQQQAQTSLVQGVPTTLQLQRFIFEGMFLDPRTTGVYAVLFFIGTFALGTLRAYVPNFLLLSIFGTIVLDVMATYGPLFPTAQYTLPRMFILPSVYYMAVALVCLILIFPESLNHVWLTSLCNDFLAPMTKTLSIQAATLSTQPSDHTAWAALTDQGYATRQGLIIAGRGLLGQIAMVDLEISVGRLGPGDLKRISGELQSLMFRTTGLHAFQIFVNNINNYNKQEQQQSEELDHLPSKSTSSSTPNKKSRVEPKPLGPGRKSNANRSTHVQRRITEREAQHGHDLDTLVPILHSSSLSLRQACEEAVAVVDVWVRECNSGRWTGFFFGGGSKEKAAREKATTMLMKATERLKTTLGEWRQKERVGLIKPYERFFDEETGRLKETVRKDKMKEMFAARSLFICFVFSYSLDAFAERLLQLLDIMIELDVKRPRPRVWMPSGFGKLGRKITSRRAVEDKAVPLAMGTPDDPTQFNSVEEDSDDEEEAASDEERAEGLTKQEEEEEEEIKYWDRRNPDALPATTAFGRSLVKVGAIFRFFKSAEGIFALRHAVVSVALWVPAVCPSTAWFYYENRGLWALIMAQMGLEVYAGDQIAGFVVRLAGTIVGLLAGMAVWYIGAGSGDGNPYGIVIATTVFVAPVFFCRIAAPPQQLLFWTMVGVTLVLVVGFSWIDTHLAVLSNPGVGVTIGWKRALLVIIGSAATFIVMMFPHLTSSRSLVRQTLAATAGEIGHILAVEIEALLAEEKRLKTGHYEKVEFVGNSGRTASAKERRVRRIAQKIVVVVTRLQVLAPSLSRAKYDPQVQGIWPYEKYSRLHQTQIKLLSSLALFTGAFAKLDTKWCSVLVLHTPFLNPDLLADIFSTISILSYALSGGQPLPACLPILRDRVVYHERLAAHVSFHSPPPATTDESQMTSDESDPDSGSDLDMFAAHKVDGSSIGFEEMTLDILTDEQLPAHSTALVALSNVISLVDEMAMIVRDLCGEKTFRGFDDLQRDFLGREEKLIGVELSQRMR